MLTARLGDHLEFLSGSPAPARTAAGRYPVYGANGAIGYALTHNAGGPVIVVGRVGSYCGSVHYCASDAWITENALVCRAKQPAETRYWYYALQTCRLNEHRAGSGQPLLNQRVLRDVPVRVVDPRERRGIAELLGALDDKIAANQKVITAAEALMAATAESVTDRVPLSRLAGPAAPLCAPGRFAETVAHFSLPAFDDDAKPHLVAGRSVKSTKFLLSEPCVLVAKLNPGIPRIWNVVRLPSEMALASTEFVVLTPRGIDTSALWAALHQRAVTDALQRNVGGTTGSRQRIKPAELLEVAVPDVRLLADAALRGLTSLGVLCDARRAECMRLAALRDGLLPLLMSGELRIGFLARLRDPAKLR